jgi:glycolate oxidase iron-sulfur subunit
MTATKENSCAKCGACTAVCPVYQVTGQESLTARGRLHLLEKLGDAPHSQKFLEIFSKCLLCDACRHSCPRHIDLPAMIAAARHDFPRLSGHGSFARLLLKKCLSSPPLLAGLGALLRKLPVDSGLRLKLGLLDRSSPQDAAEPLAMPGRANEPPADFQIFPGCFARHLTPEITGAAAGLIAEKTTRRPTTPDHQNCCGIAAYSSGDLEEARRLARINIAAFGSSDSLIIILCGSCYSHLQKYPELLADDSEWCDRAGTFAGRLREMSDFLATRDQHQAETKKVHENQVGKKVFYHDPCHLRYNPELRNAPRQLIQQLPGVELVEPERGPQCCGLGGIFNLAHPDLSSQIAGHLIDTIRTADPDLVVTTCSGCLIQLREKLAEAGSMAKVRHLALFLANPDR